MTQDRSRATRSSSATSPAPIPTSTSRPHARLLAEQLPAALVPRLALVDELPTRTSGKVDRNALPWPLPGAGEDAADALGLDGTAGLGGGAVGLDPGRRGHRPRRRLLRHRRRVALRGAAGDGTARTVPRGHRRRSSTTIRGSASLAEYLDELAPAEAVEPRIVDADTRDARRCAQIAATRSADDADRAAVGHVAGDREQRPRPGSSTCRWAPTVCRGGGCCWRSSLFITPIGRMAICVVGARLLLRGLRPGHVPARRQSEHLRLWIALRLTEASGAANLSGAPWMVYYARALGAEDRQAASTCTPCRPSPACSNSATAARVEPEVDLSGHWIDGDVVHIGAHHDRRRRVGRRPLDAAARRQDRQERRGRARLRGVRPSEGRTSNGPARPPPRSARRPPVAAGALRRAPPGWVSCSASRRWSWPACRSSLSPPASR